MNNNGVPTHPTSTFIDTNHSTPPTHSLHAQRTNDKPIPRLGLPQQPRTFGWNTSVIKYHHGNQVLFSLQLPSRTSSVTAGDATLPSPAAANRQPDPSFPCGAHHRVPGLSVQPATPRWSGWPPGGGRRATPASSAGTMTRSRYGAAARTDACGPGRGQGKGWAWDGVCLWCVVWGVSGTKMNRWEIKSRKKNR